MRFYLYTVHVLYFIFIIDIIIYKYIYFFPPKNIWAATLGVFMEQQIVIPQRHQNLQNYLLLPGVHKKSGLSLSRRYLRITAMIFNHIWANFDL